ncbi:MAG: B12-binding domain-containing radical SAM protein [Acidobacteriaceae bacterium]
MRVHLINPSDKSFGIGVITPRWLYVLAAATPAKYGDPIIADETLSRFQPETIQPGDVVGIGIHTSNALRGMTLGRIARERGAYVVFGGVHASLFPQEAIDLGGAHAVVTGDGDPIWGTVISDLLAGNARQIYEGGRISGDQFIPARWDLAPRDKYMWASVQTVRGCPKHCSFCSVWRTDGQKPRPRSTDSVVVEIVDLRRRGFRFIVLADDNFYPVSMRDLRLAENQGNTARVRELQAIRAERFELMSDLARLPKDMVFFTQITMEAGEDPEFLDAMHKAHISGALVGVESATPEGLKAVFKDFNLVGDNLARRLQTFKQHGIHVLGSFIFGLSTDRADTFAATAELAKRAGISFAQFVLLTPLPGTIDFERWEKSLGADAPKVQGVPITRYWLIPAEVRPNVFTHHPTLSPEEIRRRTQAVWDDFYSIPAIWQRSGCTPNLRARLAFLFVSKLYRQMYAKTGIATDSARRQKASRVARWLAIPCRKLFEARPMPELKVPRAHAASPKLLPIMHS